LTLWTADLASLILGIFGFYGGLGYSTAHKIANNAREIHTFLFIPLTGSNWVSMQPVSLFGAGLEKMRF
jgi:hypothetical protein